MRYFAHRAWAGLFLLVACGRKEQALPTPQPFAWRGLNWVAWVEALPLAKGTAITLHLRRTPQGLEPTRLTFGPQDPNSEESARYIVECYRRGCCREGLPESGCRPAWQKNCSNEKACVANAVEQCLDEDPSGCVAVYWAKRSTPPALSPAEIAKAWHAALSQLPAEEDDFIWAVVDLSQPGTFQVKELRWGIAFKRRRCTEMPPSREPGPLVLHFYEQLPSSPEESTLNLKYLATCDEQYMTCAQGLQMGLRKNKQYPATAYAQLDFDCYAFQQKARGKTPQPVK